MNEYYENGPEGMPRVERMTDSTIMAVLSQKNVPTIYVHSEQDYASLRLFAHAIAEETLARVPAWPVARTTYPVSEQNETVAVLPNGRTAANVYEAYRIGMEQTAVELAAPDTSQDWAKLDGATAFHLIERHAEDWAETGGMMESWLAARMAAAAPHAQAPAAPVAEQGELPRAIGVSRDAESPGMKGVLVAFERPLSDNELRSLHDLLAAAPAEPEPVAEPHPDDIAVDKFSAAMKAKMAVSRAKGRGGWDDPEECDVEDLACMLVQHVEKGDPVDIGNFCMMIWNRVRDTGPDTYAPIAEALEAYNAPLLAAIAAPAIQQPQDERAAIEEAAKAIYPLLPGDEQGSPADHPWQEGGNSNMQDLARRMARAAVAKKGGAA